MPQCVGPRPARPTTRPALRPLTPPPERGSTGTPCRTTAHTPAMSRVPRPRRPGRQGCRRPRRRLPAPKARARRAHRPAAPTPWRRTADRTPSESVPSARRSSRCRTCARPRAAGSARRRRRIQHDCGVDPQAPQPRGISFHGMPASARRSPGRPRIRSPKMLRMTSDVPPSMVLARLRRNRCWIGPCQSLSPMRLPLS